MFQMPGPITVFAPTDEALAKLPSDIVNRVITDPSFAQNLLSYHVVPGEVRSTDLSDGMMVTTANGEDIIVSVGDAGIFINETSQVVVADKEADNGIVHFVNEFFLPPSLVDVNELDLSAFNVVASPNPFDDVLTVQYELPERAQVQIDLLDLSGKHVKSLNEYAVQPAGQYQFDFEAKNIPSGMYSLTFTIDGQTGAVTVMKQ